ncbi:MAG: FGGY-family carbohydrate kinase [Lachnospiraceae bacterium]|nr:FGGY-family carbohydrate kinase [Lachnospiraceae bacterium]
MHYFLGLDNGGTATKAALFDQNGREIGTCNAETQSITPRPGFVERDMEEMWYANCSVVKGVLVKTGVDPKDIRGIGVSGHGKGLYLWGKDNRPNGHGIISTDNRAWRYSEQWKKDGTEDRAFKLSCQHVMACQPVALLAWLKKEEPERYANIQSIFECKDYIRYRLTNEARAEVTDYSGSGLMNLKTGTFDPELLKIFGIEEVESALPPLVGATEVAGYVTEEAAEETGLACGTPVIGGMFDINACAIGSGVTDPDKICMIAGTWSINEYIRTTPVLDGKVQMNSLFALPGYYLIEESSPTSAGNFEWFIRELLPEAKRDVKAKMQGTSIYDVVDNWVEQIPPTEFVPIFLPFLMASNVHPNARGTFVGLNVSHTRRHMARSIFEGITFCHRYHFEKLMATRETAPHVIRLSGGAAKADVWAQMFADVLGYSVETVAANEVGALGIAVGCAVATGEYADLDEAVAKMTGVSKRFEPNPAVKDIYDRKYALYVKTVECLDPLWDDMQALVDGKYTRMRLDIYVHDVSLSEAKRSSSGEHSIFAVHFWGENYQTKEDDLFGQRHSAPPANQ